MATTGDRLTTQEPNVTLQKGSKVLTPPTRNRPSTPAEQEADTVQVWPHLVVIEFLGAIIITINLVLLGTLVNGPLADLANPDKTPNPSKAPWYFLNLQELLLHMDPALAGVIVPSVALGLIAIIPYVDRGTNGLGIWFYNKRGRQIAAFSAIYSILVTGALIALDKIVGLKPTFTIALATSDTSRPPGNPGALAWLTDMVSGIVGGASVQEAHATTSGLLVNVLAGWVAPTLLMLISIAGLMLLLRVVFKNLTLSEMVIGLFTGFVIVYAVLTFVGTAMRGPGMDLFPPWAVPPGSTG
ncbi:MAG: menaquinol-cytochrome C reductase [Chloroflexi bacterium]|nr:menaquinol-cytochrome C reductase [Chloroflexota bacterium]